MQGGRGSFNKTTQKVAPQSARSSRKPTYFGIESNQGGNSGQKLDKQPLGESTHLSKIHKNYV